MAQACNKVELTRSRDSSALATIHIIILALSYLHIINLKLYDKKLKSSSACLDHFRHKYQLNVEFGIQNRFDVNNVHLAFKIFDTFCSLLSGLTPSVTDCCGVPICFDRKFRSENLNMKWTRNLTKVLIT